MNLFKKYTLLIIASIFILVSLTTCKKYPENVTWFKIAKWHCPINGYITEYKVNGIDSLDLLNTYYNKNYINVNSYNNSNKDVKQESFAFTKYNNKGVLVVYTWINRKIKFGEEYIGGMGVIWDKRKKNIRISSNNVDTFYFKKNIFIESDHTWKVMCLDKNGKSKIKTTFNNGNTYEITFN